MVSIKLIFLDHLLAAEPRQSFSNCGQNHRTLEESLDTKPEPIKYELQPIKMRHYGKNIERMIARAAEYPEGEERDALVMLLANHMKKLIFQINNEDVEDAKIFKDLAYYSHGVIRLDPETHHLYEYQVVKPAQPAGKKKKKK